jgi:hypothetical protein
MIEQVESLLPEGTDPAEFWASLSEAVARMNEQQEQQQAGNDHDEPMTPTVADVVQVRDAVDIREGEINHARFEIHAVEGGRYGEVSVTPVDSDTDTPVAPDPTAGVTASGNPRQRARRADPDTVAGHVYSTMQSIVTSELQLPNVKRGADSSITWVLESPRYDALGDHRYAYYNSRSLMDDVLSVHNQAYTKAQLRAAVKRLITNGVVIESGKNSKATRYTMEPTMYAEVVTRAKNEEDV